MQGLQQCPSLSELELTGQLTAYATTLFAGWISSKHFKLDTLRLRSSGLAHSQLQQLMKALRGSSLSKLGLIDFTAARWRAEETVAMTALMQNSQLNTLVVQTTLSSADVVAMLGQIKRSKLVCIDLRSSGLDDLLDADGLAGLCRAVWQVLQHN